MNDFWKLATSFPDSFTFIMCHKEQIGAKNI